MNSHGVEVLFFEKLVYAVLVWNSCCGEAAIYCPGVEVLLWGGCYVMSW